MQCALEHNKFSYGSQICKLERPHTNGVQTCTYILYYMQSFYIRIFYPFHLSHFNFRKYACFSEKAKWPQRSSIVRGMCALGPGTFSSTPCYYSQLLYTKVTYATHRSWQWEEQKIKNKTAKPHHFAQDWQHCDWKKKSKRQVYN